MKTIPATLAVLAFVSSILSGCTPVGVVATTGATAGAATMKAQGFEQSLIDTRIDAELNGLLFQKNADLFGRTTVSVIEGVVMLTGIVPDVDLRNLAGRLAWQVDGVNEVINELQISASSDLQTTANDVWITTQLNGILLADEEVASINYEMSTTRGTVYYLGLARNEAERDRVIALARNVQYVNNVISHIRLFDDPRRKIRN